MTLLARLTLILIVAIMFSATWTAGEAQWAGFGRAIKSDSGGEDPWRITAGDFNGDGLVDLAVAHGNEKKISILPGRGDGTFAPAINTSIGGYPWDIAAADLNADGAQDVVTTYDAQVRVMLGNGDATLLSPASYALPPSSYSAGISTGDFNGDNRIDLAVPFYTVDGNKGVSVLLNKGDGAFFAATHLPLSSVPLESGTADFNGDGKLDLLITADQFEAGGAPVGQIIVLPGNGDGTFAQALNSAASPLTHGLPVADFNADGKLDLAVSHTGLPFTTTVYLGNGDGTFHAGAELTGQDGYTIAASDFNGDSKSDLAFIHTADNSVHSSIYVLAGKGDGTFQPRVESAAGASPLSFAVADFNDDGRPDIATGYNSISTYVSVSLNSVIVAEPCQSLTSAVVITDAVGDANGNQPAQDIETVSVAETLSSSGEQEVVFTIKVVNLSSAPEGTNWSLGFKSPYRFGNGGINATYYNGHMEFSTGAGAESNFTTDGAINIHVPRRLLDMDSGETLANFYVTATRSFAELFEFFDAAPNGGPQSSTATYTLSGLRPCADETPTPTPTPTATPASTPSPTPSPTLAPALLTEEGTDHAVALDSVTFSHDSFSVDSTINFSSDHRSVIVFFAANLELGPDESLSAITAQAEDAQHVLYPLTIEFAGAMPECYGVTQLNIKLPSQLRGAGEVRVTIALHGAVSNAVRVKIN